MPILTANGYMRGQDLYSDVIVIFGSILCFFVLEIKLRTRVTYLCELLLKCSSETKDGVMG